MIKVCPCDKIKVYTPEFGDFLHDYSKCEDCEVTHMRDQLTAMMAEVEEAKQIISLVETMTIKEERTGNVATDIADRIIQLRSELDDAYAEMSKQYRVTTSVFNREVWKKMKLWRSGIYEEDENEE